MCISAEMKNCTNSVSDKFHAFTIDKFGFEHTNGAETQVSGTQWEYGQTYGSLKKKKT